MSDPPALNRPALRGRVLFWLFQVLFLAALFIPGQLYADDKYWLSLFSRFMALALFALSVDLVWGYTGLLSLGQGLYFGLGAYAAGYSLKLREAARTADAPFQAGPDMPLPDFMAYCRLEAVPSWIAPLIDLRLALVVAVLLPVLVATVFGLLVFHRRIKGVYFSLITQALVLAVFTLVANQQPYTGGVVGMTRLDKLELFGHRFLGVSLYLLIVGVLIVCYLGSLILVRSKFGKVLTAIRDNEYRVLALGYNTAMYKTFVLAFAAALSGLAGALYVSTLGTTGPDSFGIAFSIEVVIFVAVGGRGTLIGAILGAVLVSLANTILNNDKALSWDLIRCLLLIGMTVLLTRLILPHLRTIAGHVARSGRPAQESRPATLSSPWILIPLATALAGGVAYGLLQLADKYIIRREDEAWPLILGGLFIGIVVFLPEGIVGGILTLGATCRQAWESWKKRRQEGASPRPSTTTVPAPTDRPSATSLPTSVQALAGDSPGM